MARGKVRLAYIQNDSNRRITYRKRKVGLVKKLDELTTLCAIEACCIIYSIFDPEPMIWPSVEEAHRLITKFRSSSMVDQVKRKVNQETFMRQMLQKMEEKLKKLQGENRRKEITQIMYQSTMNLQATLSRLDMADFEDLSRVTKQKVIEIDRMMEIRMRQEASFIPPPLPPHGGGQQLVLSQDHESMLPNQYGRFPSSRPTFTMPIMTFPPPPPPPPSMGTFPSTNMEFSPRPPQGGSGGGNVEDGGQQFVLGNEFEFMPPNQDERFQSWNPALFMPNMMFPPHPNMEFSLPPPQGGADGNGTHVEGGAQQLAVLSNEFESMTSPNYNRVQPLSPGFAMPSQAFPPPLMPFSLPNMDFSSVNMDVPPNEVANIDPNIEIPYPSNQPMFPYNHNPNMAPQDP